MLSDLIPIMSAEETDVLQMSNDFYSMFRNSYLSVFETKKKDKSTKAKQNKLKSRISVSLLLSHSSLSHSRLSTPFSPDFCLAVSLNISKYRNRCISELFNLI